MKTQAELDIIGNLTTSSIEAVKRTGIELVAIGHGSVTLKMPLKGNENHVNMMYAGSLFALAELPGGVVMLSALDAQKYYPVIGEMSIRYLKPALTDITVEAALTNDQITQMQADLDEKGKCKYVLELELEDESGDVIAVTTGTYIGLAR